MSGSRSANPDSVLKHGCTAGWAEHNMAPAIPGRRLPVDSVQVAALYIDPRGPYPTLLGAEHCWDAARDARSYDGPWPIVAHPPCGPWSAFKHLYRGAEHDCAPRALDCFPDLALEMVEVDGLIDPEASELDEEPVREVRWEVGAARDDDATAELRAELHRVLNERESVEARHEIVDDSHADARVEREQRPAGHSVASRLDRPVRRNYAAQQSVNCGQDR